MPLLIVHIKTALKIALVVAAALLAANLIDVDHIGPGRWSPQQAAKCATYATQEEFAADLACTCPQNTNPATSTCRGVLHSAWFALFMAALASGIILHLWMDDVI